ncbi:MAG: hypothetical protein NT145_08325 [Elusimicrobia bacterium]|nr:hypothetical protein [Elusimicrobiota bacterium]
MNKMKLSKLIVDFLIYYLGRDKKRIGRDYTMILSQDVGKQSKHDDLKENEIRAAYKDFVMSYPK